MMTHGSCQGFEFEGWLSFFSAILKLNTPAMVTTLLLLRNRKKKNEKPLEKTTPQIVVGHERGASRGVLEGFLLVNKGCSFEL